MVEIISTWRRSSIWRNSEELINLTSETRNRGYDVIVGGELFIDYPDHPANLSR